MKAFESFMEKNFPRVRITSADYEYARQLWRGALEWYLGDGDCGGYECMSDLRKELRE